MAIIHISYQHTNYYVPCNYNNKIHKIKATQYTPVCIFDHKILANYNQQNNSNFTNNGQCFIDFTDKPYKHNVHCVPRDPWKDTIVCCVSIIVSIFVYWI